MPISKNCCNNYAIKNASTNTCSSTCCKVLKAWVMDCQYITTETSTTALTGVCTLGTLTGFTVAPATQKVLHVLELDTTFANTYKYSTSVNTDSGCTEWSLESTFRVEYKTPDQMCAVTNMQGSRAPLLVWTSKTNFGYTLLNYTGEGIWTMEQQGCMVDLKLTMTAGSGGPVPFQVGGTELATATFIAANLSTV